ncbi:MAG: hypothetical protein HRU75_06250 [Planctomycetia bacterium]|nr:MAG: hypothetical protein HRU75_06250 [Planctomycetia bacterium]
MPRSTWIAVVLLSLTLIGSLATTGGAAWYLRSGAYRDYCSRVLSETLGLPAEVGSVTPRSLQTRQFNNVRVWLPDRRGIAFRCRFALYENRPSREEPEAYALRLSHGECEISSRTWLAADYRRVVESGLRPGFAPDGPTEVAFTGMDLVVAHEEFRMRLAGAAGQVRFENEHAATAVIFCRDFNGHETRDPVTLTAAFSPADGAVRIDRLELRVPQIPLGIAGVGSLFGASVASGTFSGRLIYTEETASPLVRRLEVSGTCTDVRLAEFASPFLGPGVQGHCPELELIDLAFVDRMPTHLRFRAVIRDAVLGQLLAPLGFGELGGHTVVQIRDAEFNSEGIMRVSLSAECRGASLQGLSAGLGLGRASGRLNLSIADLRIENNRVVAMDAELRVDESAAEERWVDGELLTTVAQRVLEGGLPGWLSLGPGTRVAYKRLGARLEVRDEVLRVYGTHGPRSRGLLSVDFLGREVVVASEPEGPIDLRPALDEARRRLAEQFLPHWRERLIPPDAPANPE